MNPGRRDRWAPYRRRRLVLVRRDPYAAMPWQGIVVEWRRHRGRWSALVAYVDDELPDRRGRMVMEWFSADRLVPVPVDPNMVSGDRPILGRGSDGPDY